MASNDIAKIENLFLSVGAMKAGTTWLYEQLKNHNEIFFTQEKEIHYFANIVGIENQLSYRNRLLKFKGVMEEYCHGNPSFISSKMDELSWYANYAKAKDISDGWYIGLFGDEIYKGFCADFSNLYCQMGFDGWNNVRKVTKNLKVIYTLRDPLERLWSHYKFHMKWMDRENDVPSVHFDEFKKLLDQHYFWINAQYSRNYDLLKESLADDELMVLYFEDFRKNPEAMLYEVQRFLGVELIPAEKKDLNKKVNKTKSFSLPPEWRDYMLEKLAPEIEKMEKAGIWHPSWNKGET